MHFVKILAGDFTRQMNVPKKFMNYSRGQTSNFVDLKGPSGNVWHVRIAKIAGDLFLRSGWKYFVKAHSLEEDDVLVFRLNEHYGFDVLIFEGNGCEKASSFFAKNKTSHTSERRNESTEISGSNSFRTISFETTRESSKSARIHCRTLMREQSIGRGHVKPAGYLDDDRPAGKECNSKSGCYDTHNDNTIGINKDNRDVNSKIKSGSNDNEDDQRDINCKITSGSYNNDNIIEINGNEEQDINCFSSQRSSLTDAERRKFSELARAVQPGNPFFRVVVQSSYIRHGYLTVPCNFAAAHLPCKSQSIILGSPPQKQEWRVSFWTNGINKIFRRNMKRFFLDNNLKEGDLCVFELVKSGEQLLAMTVHFSRQ